MTDVSEELRGYEIGEKLRRLRLRKSMGLVELGRHTGLSPSLLSRIERGRMCPTLPTLVRIATVFGVGLEFFFGAKRAAASVVRRDERQQFPDRLGGKKVAYRFESLDFKAVERKMNAYRAEFEPAPAGKLPTHDHTGSEFLHVLRGMLELRVGEEEHVLEEGDSIYFDASLSHAYRRVGRAPCEAIVVTVP